MTSKPAINTNLAGIFNVQTIVCGSNAFVRVEISGTYRQKVMFFTSVVIGGMPFSSLKMIVLISQNRAVVDETRIV